jgi:adenosylcobinamide-GDP ribazoletransferase
MIRAVFSALSFLTVIRIPESWKSRKTNGMFAGYPVAGLLIGGLLSLVCWGAGVLFPSGVTAVVLVAVSLFLTGAIHLDGLADCADAFYGRRTPEATLAILKDPRIGTMGGAAIGISLLARFASFTSLAPGLILLALPVLSMLSRTAVILAMRVLPYVRMKEGILSPLSPPPAPALLALAIVATLAGGALFPVPTAAALLSVLLFWRLSRRRIGGCTGDVLGATIECFEIAFLLALVAAGKLGAQPWTAWISSASARLGTWWVPSASR